MSWLVLALSGVLEAVWATALGRSDGFKNAGATVVFGVALVLSMVGLAYACAPFPPGRRTPVWVGIGAALTVGYAMATGTEPASLLKVLLLVGCVVGLKVLHGTGWRTRPPGTQRASRSTSPGCTSPAV